MCATLTKKFMDCMKDYQKAQVSLITNMLVWLAASNPEYSRSKNTRPI